jgi:hypothetical protein
VRGITNRIPLPKSALTRSGILNSTGSTFDGAECNARLKRHAMGRTESGIWNSGGGRRGRLEPISSRALAAAQLIV